tara:strand:+ start:1105 stop:2070 length:966 start_codon:yes stop_codon:yes gene_type:complete
MAKYKDIKGTNVLNVDADPSNPVEGQVWYNRSSRILKAFRLTATASYASIPALNTPRSAMATGGAGDVTAGLVYGGWPATNQADSEEFDGTSWSASPDLNVGTGYAAGFGTQTAAVMSQGQNSTPPPEARRNIVEEYDGSSWTSVTAAPYTATYLAGAGVLTAGIVAGGVSGGYLTTAIEYDGTNWTSATAVPATVNYHCACGTQTAALFGGSQVTTPNQFFEYDGSSWTAGGTLPNAQYSKSMTGIQTNAIYIGKGSSSNETGEYDGSTWTDGASVPYAHGTGAAGGNTAAGENTFIVAGTNAAKYQLAGVPETVSIDVD